MIYGIGVDIAAIDRFQNFIDKENHALINRLFTEQEQSVCSGRKESASCYAARFSAKEAFLKALGTGLRDGISWHDMEINNNALGKPELILSGKAAELFQAKELFSIQLSLSHDGGNAIAMVVLESK